MGPSFVLELIGPAGAGKSTLCRALASAGVTPVVDRKSPRRPDNLPFFLGSALRLLPHLLRAPATSVRFARDDLARMVYLTGMARSLGRVRAAAVALDHGPIFQLAHLNALGPAELQEAAFARWWRGRFREWSRCLDLVVWLDAPDPVLLERIRARPQPHAAKTAPDADAQRLLQRYRASFHEVLGRLEAEAPLEILRFSTEATSVGDVADAIRERIDRSTSGGSAGAR